MRSATDVAATVLSATVLSQPVQTLDSLRAARHGSLDSEGVDVADSVELPLMEVRALLPSPAVRLLAQRRHGLQRGLQVLLDALRPSPTRVWTMLPQTLRVQ